ncbi:Phage major tail protein TP901-1 [uncultured Caudovirales phage]|uniref:Phage major tail protein TP901-1 n=1 Tax=uncultured Caudovirales phage TaxID=2100421 RepID=A0A6J5N6K0_9CAUD|nr:Phage major tail protein TP901-1 [uncultured Caudovirales phage]
MENYKGEDRILYIKIDDLFIPIGCLNQNSFSESVDTIDTTTRENLGWTSVRPVMQSYSISFDGIQILTTTDEGDTTKASYDLLKSLKRDRVLLDWQIKGNNFPIVDYGKCYITDLSEATPVNELITFAGILTGYGEAFTTSNDATFLFSNGLPTTIVEDGNTNLIKVT